MRAANILVIVVVRNLQKYRNKDINLGWMNSKSCNLIKVRCFANSFLDVDYVKVLGNKIKLLPDFEHLVFCFESFMFESCCFFLFQKLSNLIDYGIIFCVQGNYFGSKVVHKIKIIPCQCLKNYVLTTNFVNLQPKEHDDDDEEEEKEEEKQSEMGTG